MYEVLITRVTVLNNSNRSIPINPKYLALFHGKSHVAPGRTIIRYPVTNEHYSRLFTEFEHDYPNIVLNFAGQSIQEYR